ncbi:MAG TPA: DUF1552 domain-containing protein [Polyangia bacterium]|nr:DUF1552 domain-containing protein [Polyangia bacterium]
MNSKNWSRRRLLKGAGVALGLPWLETFAPRTARAQLGAARRRFVSLYFPNGAAEYWHPTGAGLGDNWKLSPILEPATPIKQYMTVLQNVGYPPGLRTCNPNHSQLCAGMWTCTQPDFNPAVARNATSVDQLIAQAVGGATTLPSLQVGCSTMNSYTDTRHPAHSRSISWASPTQPLYKLVNPQAVFDRLVANDTAPPSGAGNNTPSVDPVAERRRLQRKSVLDYVMENATGVQPRLGTGDRKKVDEFMTSVRDLEKRVSEPIMPGMIGAGCTPRTRPPEAYAVASVPPGYNREKHVTVMTDLVALALQCDKTRVVSYMLDDARSDFAYTFLKLRNFTAAGSTPSTMNVSNGAIASGLTGYHGLQHAGDTNDGFATINHWMVQRATELVQKLAASPEGAAGSVLDQTVIVFGSGMHGGNHRGIDIPFTLIGGGGGVLKKNFFANPPGDGYFVGDIHLTIMQKVFGMNITSFGPPTTQLLPDILA